jgi:hypothetical protein
MVTGSPGFCAQLVKARIAVSVNITIYATHQLLTSSIVMTMKGHNIGFNGCLFKEKS